MCIKLYHPVMYCKANLTHTTHTCKTCLVKLKSYISGDEHGKQRQFVQCCFITLLPFVSCKHVTCIIYPDICHVLVCVTKTQNSNQCLKMNYPSENNQFLTQTFFSSHLHKQISLQEFELNIKQRDKIECLKLKAWRTRSGLVGPLMTRVSLAWPDLLHVHASA